MELNMHQVLLDACWLSSLAAYSTLSRLELSSCKVEKAEFEVLPIPSLRSAENLECIVPVFLLTLIFS